MKQRKGGVLFRLVRLFILQQTSRTSILYVSTYCFYRVIQLSISFLPKVLSWFNRNANSLFNPRLVDIC